MDIVPVERGTVILAVQHNAPVLVAVAGMGLISASVKLGKGYSEARASTNEPDVSKWSLF